jgi:hypothetical protein
MSAAQSPVVRAISKRDALCGAAVWCTDATSVRTHHQSTAHYGSTAEFAAITNGQSTPAKACQVCIGNER